MNQRKTIDLTWIVWLLIGSGLIWLFAGCTSMVPDCTVGGEDGSAASAASTAAAAAVRR